MNISQKRMWTLAATVYNESRHRDLNIIMRRLSYHEKLAMFVYASGYKHPYVVHTIRTTPRYLMVGKYAQSDHLHNRLDKRYHSCTRRITL